MQTAKYIFSGRGTALKKNFLFVSAEDFFFCEACCSEWCWGIDWFTQLTHCTGVYR